MRPQQGEEGVVEIAKQALTGKRQIGESLVPAGRWRRSNLRGASSHLEEAEPARAELVLALAVLQREELDKLADEQRVREVVKDDLLPLFKQKISSQ